MSEKITKTAEKVDGKFFINILLFHKSFARLSFSNCITFIWSPRLFFIAIFEQFWKRLPVFKKPVLDFRSYQILGRIVKI